MPELTIDTLTCSWGTRSTLSRQSTASTPPAVFATSFLYNGRKSSRWQREMAAGVLAVTRVPGADQCAQFDSYGPMGQPPAPARDYAAARELPGLSAEA